MILVKICHFRKLKNKKFAKETLTITKNFQILDFIGGNMGQKFKYGWVGVIFFCIAFLPQNVQALINVPSDYPTIQEALDNAASGETVLVQPGIYKEHLNLNLAKNYDLEGVDSDTTIIDGTYTGITVTIDTLQDVRIANLTIMQSSGDGIHYDSLEELNSLLIENTVIKDNNLNGFYYGGSPLNPGPTVVITITDSIITNNGENGIYLVSSDPYIVQNCDITFNHKRGISLVFVFGTIQSNYIAYNNGGIIGGGHIVPYILGNIIEYNVADNPDDNEYAAIYINSGIGSSFFTVIMNNLIRYNESLNDGIIQANGYELQFVNNYVYQNISHGTTATVFCSTYGDWMKMKIINNTISENTSTLGGGGLRSEGGIIHNNIFSFNSNYGFFCPVFSIPMEMKNNNIFGNSPSEILLNFDEYSDMAAFNSDFSWADNNISCNPQFLSPGDYHIAETSCCIDQGVIDHAPDTDLDGEHRPMGRGYDIGADEYFVPQVPFSGACYLLMILAFSLIYIRLLYFNRNLEEAHEERYNCRSCF